MSLIVKNEKAVLFDAPENIDQKIVYLARILFIGAINKIYKKGI